MSLKAYLDQFRGKTDDWAIDLLDVGYNIEFGLETKDQSSLNMVDFIGTDLSQPFQMFGESDEVFRIKGGSSALINALIAALQNKIEMKQGYALTALDHKDGKIVTSFDAPGGAQTQSFDAMILALPFTKLRQVKGLEDLELGDDKLKCIRELGYGQNAKVLQGTTSRVWRSAESGLPAPSNGTFYSDFGFQNLWDSSRAQPGEAGIITDFLGAKAGLGDAKSALDAFRADLPKMSPKMAESLDPGGGRFLVLERLSLHAGQLCERQSRTIHDDVGGGVGARSRRPPAICRRAHQQRLSWLYEWRRRKRQPRRRRAHRGHGTAKEMTVKAGR